jgi:hypothetical protein
LFLVPSENSYCFGHCVVHLCHCGDSLIA